MREIKFRGKSKLGIAELDEKEIKHNDGWVTGNLIRNGNMPFIVGDIVDYEDEYITHEQWSSVHPETVGQYTGTKDKNGTKICEGDILSFLDYDSSGEQGFACFREVVFEDGCYHITNSITTSELFNYEDGHIQVIGNIYENPNLLEVEND